MMEASHLFSISRKVASGVDFLVGITAVDGAFVVAAAGELAFAGAVDFTDAAGELLLLAAGELLFTGSGVFSVVTDTLGSFAEEEEVSGAAASGVGAGVSVSSWAKASGAAAKTNAVRARMVNFIGMFLFGMGLLGHQVDFPSARTLSARQTVRVETNPILPPPPPSRLF